MSLMKKLFAAWIQPTPEELALQELQEARRDLLKAQSQAEYIQSLVNCHTARVARLTRIVATNSANNNDNNTRAD